MRIILEKFDREATGQSNGCAPRAIAKISGKSFEEVNEWLLRNRYRNNNRVGTHTRRFLAPRQNSDFEINGLKLSFENRFAMYQFGRTSVARFAAENNKGKFLILVRKHMLAIIDGVIYDVFDSSRKYVRDAHKLIENPIQENINQIKMLTKVSLQEATVEAAAISKKQNTVVSIIQDGEDFTLRMGNAKNAYLTYANGNKVAAEQEEVEPKAEKKVTAKKEPAKKAEAKKEPAKKAEAKKEPAKKAPVKKAEAKKEPAKKVAAKKTEKKKDEVYMSKNTKEIAKTGEWKTIKVKDAIKLLEKGKELYRQTVPHYVLIPKRVKKYKNVEAEIDVIIAK